ncbi:MAG: TraB/GumN family protein, partial [Chitinophagaceae bacterium]
MRKCVLFVPILLFVFTCLGQTNRLQVKKYPSLLWEITGNGLTKPSYLFGTMHVSNKLAFNLSDSFYLGIRNANVVALENNPELWQEEMTTYNSATINQLLNTSFTAPNEYLTINTLQIKEYEKLIEVALAGNSPIINNLLYRSFLGGSDFEEDTYLDMHIYQAGKKWGKKIAGVEDYKETMKLVAEAYSDARKQKNRKQKSFDFDEEFSINKLREAYRAGNLDLLDTINQLNSTS